MKRWWRLVRGLWLLWLIAGALLVVCSILWAAVVEPSWLVPDTRGLSPADRVKAQTDFRNTAVTFLGGFAVLVGGAVGAANLVLSQRVQWRAQVTDRFSKAIDQLGQQGPDKLDVRIGAVYALEQIARDSAELHWPVMEVLTAYLRQHSPAKAALADARETPTPPVVPKVVYAPVTALVPAPVGVTDGTTPADHQAIATVIGRRRWEQDPDGQRLDLHETDLSGVQLNMAHLERANLQWAHLKGADLEGAYLERALLYEASLEGARLFLANLQSANLEGAHLEGAYLGGADLKGADLYRARGLTWEQLQQPNDISWAVLPAELATRLAEASGAPPPPSSEPPQEARAAADPD